MDIHCEYFRSVGGGVPSSESFADILFFKLVVIEIYF